MYTVNETYKTGELELASFLKARGHRLLGAKWTGRYVNFEFSNNNGADEDAQLYLSGIEISARELFEAHRSLRQLIKQVREYTQQIGPEKPQHEHLSR